MDAPMTAQSLWQLHYVHREGNGIAPHIVTVKGIDKALEHIGSTVSVCGYEENEP